jgi:hypothetical protein
VVADLERPALEDRVVQLPVTDRDALRNLADANGLSVTGLLGAIVHAFLDEHRDLVPDEMLTHARAIDSRRRLRPHLTRRARREQ